MGARFGWVAIARLAVGLAIALGLLTGTSALAAITFTVTTLADTTGSCTDNSCTTLRAAIAAANSSAGNTINFTGLSGTITLTSGLPNITESMTIAGPGATGLTISANGAYQILHVSTGTVVISGLTFSNGSAGAGGAIYNAGTLTVSGSTLSGNQAAGNASVGGAIENVSILTVINSTFSDSFAATDGGAIDNTGTLTVTNSTFSGNQASNGGAISNSGTMIANNNIVAGNSAGSGAGIFNRSGTTSASHNLFYQNLDAGTTEDDCSGCTGNTNAISANPNLLPLGSYGGPTQTLLPQPGSPAICAGSYADVPSGITTDQRGFPLTNSTCSNGGVDVGAVQTGYMQVTTTADSDDGSCTASLCSLRDAITAANATNYGGDIAFASGVTGTITLTSALPAISQSMVILGPGAGTLAISGNHAYQIFDFDNSSATVTISGLTLENGNSATSFGGAIHSLGVLTVTGSTFSANFHLDSGGAIWSNGPLTVIGSTFSANSGSADTCFGGAISSNGPLTVIDSTFSANSGDSGGAIYSSGATLTVINSTFSANSARNSGGAISIAQGSNTATVTNSTFSANAGGAGGAIFSQFGTLTADNNIFTGNSANVEAGISQDSGPVNARNNLYYQNLDTGGFEDDCLACISNTNAITGINPLLNTLGSYGGPQQTMLPQPGSSAICAGSPTLIPSGITTDQRGFSRTTTYSGTTCVDLGAVQTDYTAVAFAASSYSGIANQPVNPAPVVTVTENGQNIGGVFVALAYSGTGSPTGLGPVTTVGGTGATFSNLVAAANGAQGTLSVTLPITASGNAVQPAALTASATLAIRSTTQTITFAAPSSLTYGTAPITLTATGGESGNAVVFTLDASSTPGAATLSGSTLTIHGVGTVVIDANQAAGSGYSAAPQVQQSTVVSPASLTITASSPTVTYGSAIPTITPIFGAFFNGDTSAVLTTQPICVTAYTTTSAVGSSPSTSCSGAAASNYIFTYVNGSVTVNAAPTFAIGGGGGSTSLSIEPGATTGNTVSIPVTPSNGFTGTVNLSCSISPVAASDPPTCSLSPATVTITGTAAQTATLTISTTASTVSENRLQRLLWPSTGTTLALVLIVGVPRRRRNWLTMVGVLALFVAVGATGCGGGATSSGGGGSGTGGNSGTTPGTYTITVSGTSGSVTGTAATVTLTVQ